MIGDIESMPFIEALRQLSFSVGKPVNPPPLGKVYAFFQWFSTLFLIMFVHILLGQENFCLIHVSLIPVLGVVGEQVKYFLNRHLLKHWNTLHPL